MKFTLPRFPERKPREPDPPGAVPLWWCWALTIVGLLALTGSTWMLLVYVAGSVGHVDWSSTYKATEAGVQVRKWERSADIHWLIGGGLLLFCLAIATYNAVWLELRKHLPNGKYKIAMTAIGCAVALFMVSGATVVQQRGSDAKARDTAVATQTAMAGADAIKAQIDAVDQRLAAMRDKRVNNEYAATAANVGVEAYRAQYMNAEILAREDPARRRLIERALGAAMTAETLEAQKLDLVAKLAAAQTVTAEASTADVRATGFMGPVTTFLEDARKPVTSILGELLAMTVFGAALSAWASRRQAQAAQAPVVMAIEDHSAEEKLAVDPDGLRKPEKRESYYDENGNRIVRRRATWAKVRTKKVDGTEIEQGVQMPADQRARAETVDENRLEAVGLGHDASAPPEMDYSRDVAGAEGAPSVPSGQVDNPTDAAADAGGNQREGQAAQARPGDERLLASTGAQTLDEASAGIASAVEPEPPIVLTDDRVDELIEQGIVDPDTGEIRSQEHVDIIRQDDRAARYPALADQREKEEAA